MEPTLAPAGRLRIVVAGWEGGGNVPPTLAAVEALCARGHDVTLVADDSMASDARTAGCAFRGLEAGAEPARPLRCECSGA